MWKARRPGRNLPWPLPQRRRTPVPRSSSVESGARCRMATQQMHLAMQLVAELRAACQFNPNPGAKPKSNDTKTDLIYKRAFCNYL